MSWFIYILIALIIGLITIVSYDVFSAKAKKIRVFTLADSLVNLYCGMLERVGDVFYAILFLMASQYIYENIALYQIPSNLSTWIVGLIIFDFIAYWFHRFSHEINIFWAAHIVHHQSEELNFTTVFRVSVFALIFRSMFFIWMPFLGFDPLSIVTFGVFLGFYQFLTHSRVVGRLGILEKFMTTPSHHRVHHARNEKYMDHNYGHIFIIWDKMFGTFIEEQEEPTYGITSGFESNSAYRAQFAYWEDLITRSKRAKHFADKIAVFFKPPNWTPSDVGFLPSEYRTDENGERIKRSVKLTKSQGLSVLIATLFTAIAFVDLIFTGKQMVDPTFATILSSSEILWLSAFILVSILSHGKMLENTKTAFPFEIVRLTLLVMISFSSVNILENQLWLQVLLIVYSLVGLFWSYRLAFRSK